MNKDGYFLPLSRASSSLSFGAAFSVPTVQHAYYQSDWDSFTRQSLSFPNTLILYRMALQVSMLSRSQAISMMQQADQDPRLKVYPNNPVRQQEPVPGSPAAGIPPVVIPWVVDGNYLNYLPNAVAIAASGTLCSCRSARVPTWSPRALTCSRICLLKHVTCRGSSGPCIYWAHPFSG